jgi:hypothetical protein
VKPGSGLDIFRMLIGGSVKTRVDDFHFIEDGKRDVGFAKFYDEKIKHKAESFEANRIKLLKKYILVLRLMLLIALWPLIGFFLNGFIWKFFKINADISFSSLFENLGAGRDPGGPILLYFSSLIALFLVSRSILKQFKRGSKKELLTDVFTFFGDFTYEPGWDNGDLGNARRLIKGAVFSNIFSTFSRWGASVYYQLAAQAGNVECLDGYGVFGLFPNNEAEFDKREDVILGNYQEVSLRFEEIRLFKKQMQGRGDITMIFEGAVILLSFNKKFQGRTLIKKKRDGFLHKIFKSITKDELLIGEDSLQRVHLEDLHFDKMFEVYSWDQVEARYLLTTSFMERIKTIADLLGAKGVEASFYKSSLLLSFKDSRNLFEIGSIFEETTLVKECKLAVRHMSSILDVIDTLKISEKTGL